MKLYGINPENKGEINIAFTSMDKAVEYLKKSGYVLCDYDDTYVSETDEYPYQYKYQYRYVSIKEINVIE